MQFFAWFPRLSATAIAVGVFLALNCLAFVGFQKYKSRINEDLAATQLLSKNIHPDVVFAGSSMILYPLCNLDSEEGWLDQTVSNYCHARCFEKVLSHELGRDVLAYNVAFMGFMISDDYFIVDQYLKSQQCPKVIVMMVGPRDFYDVGFESPAAGIAFRKLADLSHIVEFCGNYLSTPADYIDFAVGRLVITFAMRSRVQELLHDFLALKLQSIQSHLSCAAGPIASPFELSLREYNHRYAGANFAAMNKQFVFLSKLLNLCALRNIKVIVVNAPLTNANINLLPAGLYQQYCDRLRDIADGAAYQYVDLSKSKSYSSKEFSDSVHLNAAGARKFVDEITPSTVRVLRTTPR